MKHTSASETTVLTPEPAASADATLAFDPLLAPLRRSLPRTMQSVTLMAPRTISVRKHPLPDLRPGGVRVQLEGCGICGSNGPVWEGRPWFRYPLEPGAPGHEGWGVVDAIGDNVTSIRAGDRVAVFSQHAFAQYDVADAANVVRLPAELDGKPFPGEALGCAMNVFKRSDIQRGQTVAVVGIGFLGALLTDLSVRAGARVIALCRRPFAIGIARKMGASEVVVMEQSQAAIEQVKEITRGEGCHRVIEATGFQTPLDIASEITRERGRLIIAGYHQDGPRQVDLRSWNWRGLDVINAHERDPRAYIEGMQAAVKAVVEGRLNPAPLYTDEFKLHRLPQALEALCARPMNFLKALVTYD